MTKVATFMRKLFHKDDSASNGLQLRLRKAVALRKARQVAALLDEGASPIWMEGERQFRRRDSSGCQLNALLLSCRVGDVQVLSLLLDAFFQEPQVLAHFSRAMYCLVIRHGHWKAFQRLQQRRVPISSTDSTGSPLLSTAAMENSSSKLPMPVFVAAEHGRPHILKYLLAHYPHDWAHYTFEGHSMLSVAAINGHYECVRVLLERQVATSRSIDAAVAMARRHRQAHVLVLLTNYLPEFAEPEPPVSKTLSPINYRENRSTTNLTCQWSSQNTRLRGRGSIAETVASEFDDDSRRSSLLAISSPINYNSEDRNRVEEMRHRAEVELEQRHSGMLWFLDGREPVEEMQRRVDPYGVNADGFAVLVPPSSYHNEEEAWYAVKAKDESRHHRDLLQGDDDERSFESQFSVHEEEVNEELPPVSEERPQSMAASQQASIVRSGRSHKLISVRSRSFQQHRLLAAIEEHPSGETES